MIVEPKETTDNNKPRRGRPPNRNPRHFCGIGGCDTYYDDPKVLQKHRERVHGLGIENLNVPKERTGAPVEASEGY